jgi:hypothetical protein
VLEMRILRGLSSRFLPCGCVAGIYETYDGDVVAIIDAHTETCADVAHAAGNVVPVPKAGQTVTAPRTGRPASSHK